LIRNVVGDPKKPGPKGRAALELSEASKNNEKDIVRCVIQLVDLNA